MKLTAKQKREIAKIAVEKSETLENGLIQVWIDESGIFSILIGREYRDNCHTHVATLHVWNESKPYTQAAFIRQLEETF